MLTELTIVIVECRDASCDVIRMQMNPCKKLLRQWLVMMTYFHCFIIVAALIVIVVIVINISVFINVQIQYKLYIWTEHQHTVYTRE